MPIFSIVKRRFSAVGFVGLGNMGSPMARNLLKAGYDVIVHDADVAKAKEFSKHATSLTELAKKCSRIITMLPNNSVVEDVYLRPDGLIANAQSNATLIDCSTVSPTVEEGISKRSMDHNLNFLDAPVSGGVKGAAAGTLSFLVGGNQQVLAKNEDLFKAMGKNIIHCGKPGSGQVAKICNNLILGVSMVVLSEALHLGMKLKLDPEVLSKVINASSGRSWASELYNPVPGVMEGVPASNGYEGGFASNLMLKDMLLALDEAWRCDASLPTGKAAAEIYAKLVDKMGQKDFSAVYNQIQSLSK